MPDTGWQAIEHLDFEPERPCEAPMHKDTPGDEPAVWIVWTRCPGRCAKKPVLICDPCWQTFISYTGSFKCLDCNRHGTARDFVERIERIEP